MIMFGKDGVSDCTIRRSGCPTVEDAQHFARPLLSGSGDTRIRRDGFSSESRPKTSQRAQAVGRKLIKKDHGRETSGTVAQRSVENFAPDLKAQHLAIDAIYGLRPDEIVK